MKFSKEELEKLYDTMSLDQIADHLKIAKSTLYYYMKKFNIKRRSKSSAQKQHLKTFSHQRIGKKHTDITLQKMFDNTRRFWESSEGQVQKKKLGRLRSLEWKNKTKKEKEDSLRRLRTAERPIAGELSKFGQKLASFLSSKETVKTGIKLTKNHISDIILEDHKVVIELLFPIAIYGNVQENKLETRYNKLINELNNSGYRVVIIQDKSNSLSVARCQRIYGHLLEFFQNKNIKSIYITS